MAQITVTVNGRSYQVSCDDGQERHLAALGADLDRRVGRLAASAGQVGEGRLLLLAALLLNEELVEAKNALAELHRRPPGLSPEAEAELAQGIDALAARIEDIAARLEAA